MPIDDGVEFQEVEEHECVNCGNASCECGEDEVSCGFCDECQYGDDDFDLDYLDDDFFDNEED